MAETIYTYPYSQDYHPAIPIVEIGVTTPGDSQSQRWLTALIDSGSDGTLIPIDILEEIGARYVREARIRGIFGDSEPVDIYLVSLHLGPHTIQAARVVAAPEGAEAILGRNVLNHLVITLNGLASVTEIPA